MSTQLIIRSTSKKGTYMVHGGGFGLVRLCAVLEGRKLVIQGVHAFNGVFDRYSIKFNKAMADQGHPIDAVVDPIA